MRPAPIIFQLPSQGRATLKEPVVVAVTDVFFDTLHRIEQGMVTLTAAGMSGILEE